jgi:diguanylate cyclase (GGDEF)-like protein
MRDEYRSVDRHQSETTDPAASQATPAASTASRILVVDDVADNREILTRRLVRRGYEVTEAVGGEDALTKIGEQSFDIVLLDIMMPDISGNEVLKRVRQSKSPMDLPIIMVTAKSQSEDVVESLNLGANDYITKPVDFAVALARISTQLDRKKTFEDEKLVKTALEETTAKLNSALETNHSVLLRETDRRKLSEEKLHFLAYHDSLTGLLNRQGFRDHLNMALDDTPVNDMEIALLFIDLDAFKAVNDTQGHAIGDALLRAVADRLRDIVGEDRALARLGGDEFAVIVQSTNQPAVAMSLAEVIVERLSDSFQIGEKSIRIGASCGVARASAFNGDLDGLIKAADLAMYHAKAQGTGGAILFETRMIEEQEEKHALENDLRLAIQNSEFQVFFQPLVKVSTREVAAFEALLRWPHKTRGMISPETFIPLAEDLGLINQLGTWALREACAQAAQWPEQIRIAVNLSPIQFKNASLLPTLVNVLANTGLSPNRLELEITESALLGMEEANIKLLNSIRELGVRISMDDFGTGYSSLAYLQNFEFDKIKIDKRFIQNLRRNSNDAAIVDAIIKLGLNIGIGTTAEGIETEDQFDSVVRHGCTEGQGYLFSRPLTASDATALIEARLAREAS